MTVKEMIKELVEFDLDAKVYILFEAEELEIEELDGSSSGNAFFLLKGIERIPR